ncbi:hypothetical protein NRIC_16940 [Enterococcus florum]|uniref:Peptidase n=1 Tax=Enterococcus florum TaxID=2480627 RepID=A0A4P5PKD7_9ENTE|nr:SpaH/EbpB family LPXTG-anchored major pilin [Enterococcus florum]GCF93803.1 hypothetical protein NRIC_16940 [Enterococcus florum]
MKRLTLFISCLTVVLLAASTFLFLGQTAQAVETQTVYLHKEVTKNAEVTTDQTMLTEKQGINGAEFTVVDITNYLRNSTASLADAMETVKKVTKADIAGVALGQSLSAYPGMQVVGKGMTGRKAVPNDEGKMVETDGVFQTSLAKKSGTYDASYLFVETGSVPHAGASDNVIMHFPVLNEATKEEEEHVHVYSKNDIVMELPDIHKELSEKHQDFAYGEVIQYKAVLTIPTMIGSYQYFRVEDLPDKQLTAELDSIVLTDNQGNLIAPAIYQVSAKDNGFVIEFQPAQLAIYQGTELTLTYHLKLAEGSEPDAAFYNTIRLHYHDSTDEQQEESRSKEVYTGGYRFIKVDADQQEKTLNGAAFVIRNSKEQYLTNRFTWKETTDSLNDQELFRITSNQEGAFEVRGLAYGTYYLEEVVAPNGYRRLSDPVEFKVEKNTYSAGTQAEGILKVVNSKLPDTGTSVDPPRRGGTNATTVTNRMSKSLPQTGEKLGTAGVAAGTLIIAFVLGLFWFKKKQQINENGGNKKK